MQQIYVGKDHEDGYERPREHSMRYYESLGRLLPARTTWSRRTTTSTAKVERNVADLRYDFLYENGVSFGSPRRSSPASAPSLTSSG